MREGQDVRITAEWSSFRGQRGTITGVTSDGGAWVLLEGERKAMRFEPQSFEVLVGAVEEPNLTGAE